MSNIDKLLYIDGLGEITQNLNIGGNLNVANNINLIHNLNVNKINGYSDANNIEIGSYIDITGQFFNAHTITAQNYAVGGTNFISASRQGNFRDVEVKNTNNSDTILLTGDGGHISLEGTLSVDNINEKTSNNGITIDSVSIKNNNVTAHTITAQNYAVGSTNFISASRQGNFRDVEVKNTNNSDTILLTGDGGHISLEGTLSVDNINEKTGNNGVTIEGVILKDNNLNVSGIGTITTLNSTNITGNLIGNVTGDVTGNATTATTLQAVRTIGGVDFNGSANIDLKGVNIPGDQNTTGSAAKLTIPVNIGGVSFDGSNDIDLSGVNSTGNQNTTGSAAKLTNSVNIGGVSFDGSTSIDLPGVNSTGNQNTTGSAAKLTNSVNIGDVSFDGSNDINLSVSNGLTTSTNNRTIDIDISTSPTININTTMTLQNTSGNAVLKIKGSNQPQILFFKDNSEKGYMRYIPTEDILEIRQTNNTTKLRLGNRYSSGTTYDNNGTMVLDIDNIDVYKPIDMNDNQINFQTDNTNHFIKMNNGTGFNGLEYAGGGSGSQVAHYFKSTNGSGTDLMKMYEDNINIGRKVIIQPSANDYTAGDEYMLHIKSFEGQSCRVCIECDFNNNGEDENPSLIFKQDGENIDTILGLANDNEGIVNNNFYIHHTSHLGSISQKNGWERISFATGASGDSEKPIKENVNLRMSIGNTSMNMYNPISMNQNAINFYNDGDTAHQITWNNTDTNTTPTATGMNGLLIRGFGNTVAFCRFQSTADGNTTVMDLLKQKIHMYQPLYMNSTSSLDRPIYLHHNEAFYVRYKNDGNLNGTDLGGFSGVRLSNTNTQSTNKINLQTFGVSPRTLDAKGSVEVYNKLSVIRDGAVLQQDANDTFTVRRVGFCKAIIHSDSGDCEFAFKCGSSNSNQAVIKRKTNDQLLISNDGEYRVEVSNNTCNFVNNNGRLAFQSDRNLVIYNSGGGAIWASNTSSSERRFKDNIVSLDLENSYNIIKQLNPVSFVYIEEPTITKKGFIVDEIEDKIPECLKEITNCDCEDMKSKLLYKEDIVPDLVASVKFLINKVETLETQLLTQSNLISNLQSQLNSN